MQPPFTDCTNTTAVRETPRKRGFDRRSCAFCGGNVEQAEALIPPCHYTMHELCGTKACMNSRCSATCSTCDEVFAFEQCFTCVSPSADCLCRSEPCSRKSTLNKKAKQNGCARVEESSFGDSGARESSMCSRSSGACGGSGGDDEARRFAPRAEPLRDDDVGYRREGFDLRRREDRHDSDGRDSDGRVHERGDSEECAGRVMEPDPRAGHEKSPKKECGSLVMGLWSWWGFFFEPSCFSLTYDRYAQEK